jgi:probable F420-dependent oxidoreductase
VKQLGGADRSGRTGPAGPPLVPSPPVRFGFFLFPTDETVPPDAAGRLTEERGFEALLFPEHTHIPLDHSPYPSGGEVPRRYLRTLDPFVAVTAAALATERLLVGPGVLLVPQHDPIVTAKAVASADWLSGGRVLLGVGAGWNEPETANHGTDPAQRFRVMRERIEAMKAIWTQEEASYEGRHVRFGPLWSWPKPVQSPHPPIVVGGTGPHVLERVVAYGDEWMPNRPQRLAERVAELQRLAGEAGRAPIPVSYFGARPEPAHVEELAGAGVQRVYFPLPSEPADEVQRAADTAAAVAERWRTAG